MHAKGQKEFEDKILGMIEANIQNIQPKPVQAAERSQKSNEPSLIGSLPPPETKSPDRETPPQMPGRSSPPQQ